MNAATEWLAMTPAQRRDLCARIVPNLPQCADDVDEVQNCEDVLHDSADFVAESIGELDCIAAAKAWQARDAMELLRLMDNAFESYKRHYVGKAMDDRNPRAALRDLARIYGGAA